MTLSIRRQRERLRVGGWYTNGRDLRRVLRVGTITLEAEDAATGEVSAHGIGGFRRRWWLVSERCPV
jgi:hypothetical protein